MFGFGKTKKDPNKLIAELIEHNADQIASNENKDKEEATYLAICLVLDDLSSKPDGRKGYEAVMNLLQDRYSRHMNDVVTYVAWSTGRIQLKDEAEAALRLRHG